MAQPGNNSIRQMPPALKSLSPSLQDACQRVKTIGSDINAVISCDEEQAASILNSTPVIIKDCIDVLGFTTTYGSKVHINDPVKTEDAFVSKRLRQAGCHVIGKAHLTEFCFGATGENTHFGNCLNPWDYRRITGGSSSGSAAAVAAGIVRMALGTDTGGSVRVPSALCGIVGLRPTLGRVSNTGCLEVSTICDTIGPMAASVAETAWLYDVIQGFDSRDPLSIIAGRSAMEGLNLGVEGMVFGVARPFYCEDVEPEVLFAFEAALKVLETSGAQLRDITLGDVDERREQHAIRFVAADVAEARSELLYTSTAYIGAEFHRRLKIGAQVSGTEYAASIRSLLRLKRDLRGLFQNDIDIILTPTCPVTAPLWADAGNMVETTRKVARFTYDIGAAGVPALSVPCGTDSLGLPIGLQMIASWGDDAVLFQAAHVFEAMQDRG